MGELQMTRERAIQAMDALMGAGYSVILEGHPPTEGFVRAHDETGEVGYWPIFVIKLTGLGFDRVDLVEIDRIAQQKVGDLEVAFDQHNGLHLRMPDRTPEAVANPRRHPRVVREGPLPKVAKGRPVRDNPQA